MEGASNSVSAEPELHGKDTVSMYRCNYWWYCNSDFSVAPVIHKKNWQLI